MPDKPTITEQLRALLPEPGEDLSVAIEKVAQLEHEHGANVEQARLERAFLMRAPREGLLYPGDALKLENVIAKLGEPGELEQNLENVFTTLRSSRPYLFRKPTGSPANQKLSEHDPEHLRSALKHGSLTRQVQEIRRRRR